MQNEYCMHGEDVNQVLDRLLQNNEVNIVLIWHLFSQIHAHWIIEKFKRQRLNNIQTNKAYINKRNE